MCCMKGDWLYQKATETQAYAKEKVVPTSVHKITTSFSNCSGVVCVNERIFLSSNRNASLLKDPFDPKVFKVSELFPLSNQTLVDFQ